MAAKVTVNRAKLRAHMAASPAAQRALDTAVSALKSQAERESPVRTGYFQDRFRTRRFPLSRRLSNTDTFAHIVEWGSINNRPYAPFRRAARALGFRLSERPRP